MRVNVLAQGLVVFFLSISCTNELQLAGSLDTVPNEEGLLFIQGTNFIIRPIADEFSNGASSTKTTVEGTHYRIKFIPEIVTNRNILIH